MYADTRTSADQLYLSQFGVPDPFISIKKGARKIAVLNQLEYGRGLKESAFDIVLSFETWLAKAKEAFGRSDAGIAEIVATLARSLKIAAFQVSADFLDKSTDGISLFCGSSCILNSAVFYE